MERVSYAVQFRGNAAPPGDDPAVLKVRCEATREGATGYITSNFFVDAAGEVTGNQVRVLSVP